MRLLKKLHFNSRNTEAVAQRCSVKKLFLEISQNSQENSCARDWHMCFPVNFAKFLRTPFYRTHPVAASGNNCWVYLISSYNPNQHLLALSQQQKH